MNSPSRAERNSQIILVNALPQTLDHYQKELETILGLVPGCRVDEVITEKGDGHTSVFSKLRAASTIVARRLFWYSGRADRTFIVIWPLFGYLDILTWIRLARKSHVMIIIHDPVPLRAQIGYSSLSVKILKIVSALKTVHVIAHTQNAQQALFAATGVSASVAPHPLRAQDEKQRAVLEFPSRKKVVRVLGQYKETRSLDPLRAIAEGLPKTDFHLEISGRGWDPQDGWVVADRFLSATDFDQSIATADCVVIPYNRFYQSGVAVRSLESLVPIVGPRHPHLEELYGKDWPGLVDDRTNWVEAILNVTAPGFSENMRELLRTAVRDATAGWLAMLDRNPADSNITEVTPT